MIGSIAGSALAEITTLHFIHVALGGVAVGKKAAVAIMNREYIITGLGFSLFSGGCSVIIKFSFIPLRFNENVIAYL